VTTVFKPHGRAFLVGSLPLDDHQQAMELMMAHTPDIPSWSQLPSNPQELMIPQFSPGMPGLTTEQDKTFVDIEDDRFQAELLTLYEAYLAVSEGDLDPEETPYQLTEERARGFFTLLAFLREQGGDIAAVKGQVTGPVTFCTGLRVRKGQAIFYDDQARDAAVKLLALKARWQTRRLKALGRPVIVSLDEPALAGFGSSDMISISKESIGTCLAEIIEAIHAEGGLASIHVCANTDWSLVFDSPVDIVHFDAYSYFDRFILYGDGLRKFVEAGNMIAWGIVPTHDPEHIDGATPAALIEKWQGQVKTLEQLGIEKNTIMAQSFIAPSCGLGSLSLEHTQKVLGLTREVSAAGRDALHA
jgi:methionine synthase II (cobalamin-independent)